MALLADEPALLQAAAEFAEDQRRRRGDGGLTVGLRGDLGAGKTTWVRGMLRGLGYAGRVPSPTFTLVEPYAIGSLTVLHIDLYRLDDAGTELEALGIRDALGAPSTWLLVEWPERWAEFSALADVEVALAIAATGRDVEIKSLR